MNKLQRRLLSVICSLIVVCLIILWEMVDRHSKAINSQSDALSKWQHRQVQGKDLWIALNSVSKSVESPSREIFLFVDSKTFSIDYIKNLFIALATEFRQPDVLTITAFDNIEILNSTIFFKQRVGYAYFPPTPRGDEDLEKERITATPPTGYLRAFYYRNEYGETFQYSPDTKGEKMATVKLSNRSITGQKLLFEETKEAILQDDLVSLDNLLSKLGDVNAKDEYGCSLLMLAAKFGNPRATRFLLKRNASPKNPVTLAIAVGADELPLIGRRINAMGSHEVRTVSEDERVECVRLLLEHGAKADVAFNDGKTALMLANDSKNIMELLIQHGAIVNAKTDFGWTALMYAIHYGRHENTRLLIRRGANIQEVSNDGWTALKLAESRGQENIIQLLKGKLRE
jgi:hypothetical protein